MSSGTLWLIGCGNMAGAMLSRWLATGLDAERVTVIDPALPDCGVRVLASLPDEAAPDMLMLGVKPQMLNDVRGGLQAVTKDVLLLSILAGTTTGTLAAAFPDARAVVRVMPNLPVAIGKGAVGLTGATSGADHAAIDALMAPLGLVEWIDDEALFDAVTAVSGSGPALVYRVIEALADGGAAIGLPADQALRLARATVAGAGAIAAASDASPGELADRVASKGGSTRKMLDVLDEGRALATLIAQSLEAAQRRNAELAALTRGD